MTLSGPDGSWWEGSWDLQLPVTGWRVWLADGTYRSSRYCNWSQDVPDSVVAVYALHENGRRTAMWSKDAYPEPGGPGPAKLGEQVGELNCTEWFALQKRIRAVERVLL